MPVLKFVAPYLLWATLVSLGGLVAFKPLADLSKSAANAGFLLVFVGVAVFIFGIMIARIHNIERELQNIIDVLRDPT